MLGHLLPINDLQQFLDVAQLRHEVISSNIANINTPGYRTQVVEFESALSRHAAGDGDTKERSQSPIVTFQSGLAVRADGNNVDMERELGRLQKNALLYQTYAQVLSSQLGMMKRAIRTS